MLYSDQDLIQRVNVLEAAIAGIITVLEKHLPTDSESTKEILRYIDNLKLDYTMQVQASYEISITTGENLPLVPYPFKPAGFATQVPDIEKFKANQLEKHRENCTQEIKKGVSKIDYLKERLCAASTWLREGVSYEKEQS